MRNLLFFISLLTLISSDAVASANNHLNKKHNDALKKQMLSREGIEKVAEDFESVAITKMLQHMYNDVKIDPIFGGGSTEGIYKDLLLTEYGKIIAKGGGIGIKDSIVRDMENMNKRRRQ